MHAMQGGGQHQFSARQEESEHQLVGQRGTLDMAGAQAETDGGGIGGDQPQAVPARHITMASGLLEQPVIERRNGCRREFGARLRERLPGYLAQQLRLLLQASEELVQFGLDALAHAGEHQRDQCRQGQFATTLDARDRKQADETGQSAYGLRDRQAEWKETWGQRRSKRSSLATTLLASKKTPIGWWPREVGFTSSAFFT